MSDMKIELDNAYIPILLKEIKNEQIKARLEHTLFTYAKRAVFYKRTYYILTFSTIIFPALVSVINVFSSDTFSVDKLIITIFSALTAIAAGVLGAANIRENWITYRYNCELLKEEVFKYIETKAPYNIDSDEERERIFVDNMFKLYHNETALWKKNSSQQ